MCFFGEFAEGCFKNNLATEGRKCVRVLDRACAWPCRPASGAVSDPSVWMTAQLVPAWTCGVLVQMRRYCWQNAGPKKIRFEDSPSAAIMK